MLMSSKQTTARHAVAAERDAYGQEIWNCHKGVSDYEIVERDDGLIDLGSALPYFQERDKWPIHEREAIQRARGAILDIGCGAGRVALYLQEIGHRVLAIDNSPLAVKVTKLRGVKAARVLSIDGIQTLRGLFSSIVLYGNNFGLLGGLARARRLLAAMHKITTRDAVIIAAAADPYRTRDPVHLAYHQRNRERGRMAGKSACAYAIASFVEIGSTTCLHLEAKCVPWLRKLVGLSARLSNRRGQVTWRSWRRDEPGAREEPFPRRMII